MVWLIEYLVNWSAQLVSMEEMVVSDTYWISPFGGGTFSGVLFDMEPDDRPRLSRADFGAGVIRILHRGLDLDLDLG